MKLAVIALLVIVFLGAQSVPTWAKKHVRKVRQLGNDPADTNDIIPNGSPDIELTPNGSPENPYHVTDCGHLNEKGAHYKIVKEFMDGEPDPELCIIIVANDISLDGNSVHLKGRGNVVIIGNDATVSNLHYTGIGITVNGGERAVLKNLKASGNGYVQVEKGSATVRSSTFDGTTNGIIVFATATIEDTIITNTAQSPNIFVGKFLIAGVESVGQVTLSNVVACHSAEGYRDIENTSNNGGTGTVITRGDVSCDSGPKGVCQFACPPLEGKGAQSVVGPSDNTNEAVPGGKTEIKPSPAN